MADRVQGASTVGHENHRVFFEPELEFGIQDAERIDENFSRDTYVESAAVHSLKTLLDFGVGEQRCALGRWLCWDTRSAADARAAIAWLVAQLSASTRSFSLNFANCKSAHYANVITSQAISTAYVLLGQHSSQGGYSASEVGEAINDFLGLAGKLLRLNSYKLHCDVGPEDADGIARITRCFYDF